MIGLTARQTELLKFINGYIGKHGLAPTVQEMATGLGLKFKGGVVLLLRGLEERGAIRRLPHRRRAIEVLT